jgi:hypothetical protein
MTGRELFGVVVRAMGLASIAHGLNYGMGLMVPQAPNAPSDYLFPTAYYITLGLVGLFGARLLVGLSYATEDRPPVSEM